MPPGKKQSIIFQIAEQGDHNLMKQVLSKDKSCVNERNEQKETPLHIVCKHCYFLCVEVLLKFGAPPNAQDKDGQTPLHLALAYGTSQMLPILLRYGANPMMTDNLSRNSLHVATSQAMPKVVEVLLLDVLDENDEQDPCPCCWQKATVDLDSPLHRHHHQGRRESKRVPPNHVAMVKQEDHKGNTPLHYATSDPLCSAVALQFLDALKDHADEVVFKPVINARNKAGYVALQYAAYTGMAEVVECLIEMGATADLVTRCGESILHMACEAGDLDTTNTILNSLGDRMKGNGWKEYINLKDKAGFTALHYACLNGHLSCVRALLRHIDDLELDGEDDRQYTPLMVAKLMGYPQLCSLLESSGADGKKAKAGIKAKPNGAQELQELREQREASTMVGPSGKPMLRAEQKGDGAIPKKSYFLYWAVLVAVAACFAHYSYASFQEYLSNYDTEYYKEQAIMAGNWIAKHMALAWSYLVQWFWASVAFVQAYYEAWTAREQSE
eukprot:GGOE01014531.1.p1 GENE.GGOE01014531.1~~GGOE01014531.1.p1  ORF type:complete len:499 (-),score=102.72 GGOE01014531.1:192-1688(-)